MKAVIKDILICVFFAFAASANLYAAHANALDDSRLVMCVLLFTFLVCLAVISHIKNPILSFAVLTAVGIGMAFYRLDYISCYYPVTVFVWTVQCSREKKMSSLYYALTIGAYIVATVFCFKKRPDNTASENSLGLLNKFGGIAIVVLAVCAVVFIVLRALQTRKNFDDSNPDSFTNVGLMSLSYVWSIVFLINMQVRFPMAINYLTPWLFAIMYAVLKGEPMLINAFSFLKTSDGKAEEN